MNIKKKIRKAYESVPMPAAEDVLPAEAFEKKEKRGFAVYRPVIYVAAALCICVIVTVAAVMNKPGENVIADDTAIEDTTEVTTCEEVYYYPQMNDDYYASNHDIEMDDPLNPDDPYDDPIYQQPQETECILVKRSDGKILIRIEYKDAYDDFYKDEAYERFEEVYGFDYHMYTDPDRYEKEGIKQILGYEYDIGGLDDPEDDSKDKLDLALHYAFVNYKKIRREIAEEHIEDFLEEFQFPASADYRELQYYDAVVYVDEADIEKIRAHEAVSKVIRVEDIEY